MKDTEKHLKCVYQKEYVGRFTEYNSNKDKTISNNYTTFVYKGSSGVLRTIYTPNTEVIELLDEEIKEKDEVNCPYLSDNKIFIVSSISKNKHPVGDEPEIVYKIFDKNKMTRLEYFFVSFYDLKLVTNKYKPHYVRDTLDNVCGGKILSIKETTDYGFVSMFDNVRIFVPFVRAECYDYDKNPVHLRCDTYDTVQITKKAHVHNGRFGFLKEWQPITKYTVSIFNGSEVPYLTNADISLVCRDKERNKIKEKTIKLIKSKDKQLPAVIEDVVVKADSIFTTSLSSKYKKYKENKIKSL